MGQHTRLFSVEAADGPFFTADADGFLEFILAVQIRSQNPSKSIKSHRIHGTGIQTYEWLIFMVKELK